MKEKVLIDEIRKQSQEFISELLLFEEVKGKIGLSDTLTIGNMLSIVYSNGYKIIGLRLDWEDGELFSTNGDCVILETPLNTFYDVGTGETCLCDTLWRSVQKIVNLILENRKQTLI